MKTKVYNRSSHSNTQNRRPAYEQRSWHGVATAGNTRSRCSRPGYATAGGHARTRRRKRRFISHPVLLALILVAIAAGIITVVILVSTKKDPMVHEGTPARGEVNLTSISGPPWTIALDAGHGGNDVGALGLIQEVELTEKTVACLYALLEADPDYNPVLTREAGAGASINERVQAVNRSKADVMLSIHGNSDETGEGNGFECFPAPPGRQYHYQSFSLADFIAAEMEKAGARLRGDFGVRYIYYNANGSKFLREASDETIYEEASFGLLDNSECTAVLVEQCFITNQADLDAFGTDAGCQKAAECYYNALCTFFQDQK